MKKNLKMLAVGVLGIGAIALLVTLSNRPDPIAHQTQNEPSYQTESMETIQAATEEFIQTDPEETMQEATTEKEGNQADNITIEKVEVVKPRDRNPYIDKNHPEYIDIGYGDFYYCEMGIAFCNDRTLSITLEDSMTGVERKISFGKAIGECNRFLYFDPKAEENGEEVSYIYHFNEPFTLGEGGNSVVCDLGGNNEDAEATSTSQMRAGGTGVLQNDIVTDCSYIAPNMPGAVWFTEGSLLDPTFVDVHVYSKDGDMVAALRLTIEMQNDGSYAFTNLEDRNLVTNPNEVYTEEEQEYLLTLAEETWKDPDLVHMTTDFFDSTALSLNHCMIEELNHDTGLYYRDFAPRTGEKKTAVYTQDHQTVMAMTFRYHGMTLQTLYFRVTVPPLNGEHGQYYYIGRDINDSLVSSK